MLKKSSYMRAICLSLVLFLFTALCFSGCSAVQNQNIYSLSKNWAYLETDVSNKDADVFFVCPTVYGGDSKTFNMALDDTETKKSFLGASPPA